MCMLLGDTGNFFIENKLSEKENARKHQYACYVYNNFSLMKKIQTPQICT